MIEKVIRVKDVVIELLTKQPATRDNDRYLMQLIWLTENRFILSPSYSAMSFLRDLSDGRYSDPESIRRARQRIQEQHPELRGPAYGMKKKTLEPEMRQGMLNLNT